MSFPRGSYGRIAGRSGLAFNHSLDIMGGVIDPDYHGNIIVLLINHSDDDYEVKLLERIAQVIPERFVQKVEIKEMEEFEEEFERGSQGFGSTGK